MGVLNTTKKSTGGGGVGGSVGDRYLGTLGPIIDAPANSKYPNFLSFPAAKKGEWVRITKSQTMVGTPNKPVNLGEEWVCNETTETIGLASNWELRSVGQMQLMRQVAYVKREIYFRVPIINLAPKQQYVVKFSPVFDVAISSATIPMDQSFVDLSGIVSIPGTLYYKLFASAEFTPESSGACKVDIRTIEYLPEHPLGAKDNNGNLLLGERLDPTNLTDVKIWSYMESDSVKEGRYTVLTALKTLSTLDFYDFFQTNMLVQVSHNCAVTIGMKAASLEIEVFEK